MSAPQYAIRDILQTKSLSSNSDIHTLWFLTLGTFCRLVGPGAHRGLGRTNHGCTWSELCCK